MNKNINDTFRLEKDMEKRLVREALEARKRAYAPYSHYFVGAALLAGSGRIYRGGNIENASYGAANCAERTAFFKAVSEGEGEFVAIAIAGGMEGKERRSCWSPCRYCRQVMLEFAKADFKIFAVKSEKDYQCRLLGEIMPCGFEGSSII